MTQSWNIVSIDLKQGASYDTLYDALINDLRYIPGALFRPRILPLSSKQLREWIVWSTPVLFHNATVLSMPRALMGTVITKLSDETTASIIRDPSPEQYNFSFETLHASDSYNDNLATILVPNVSLPAVTDMIPLDVVDAVIFGPTIEYKPIMAVTTRTVGLLSLPNEMILEIFHYIPVALDAVVFGLAAERLWRVGERWIIQLISRDMAPWANTRMICVGQRIVQDDLPPNLMHDHQLLEQIKSLPVNPVARNLFGLTYGFVQRRIRWRHSSDGEPPIYERLPERKSYYISDSNLNPNAVSRLREAFSEWIRPAIDKKTGRFTDGEFILRNLSKKVYIRDRGCPLEFGNALATQICWSSAPRVGISNTTGAHRGPWAGDRFDICFLQMHEAEVNKTGDGAVWKDVSEEVARYMANVWENELGFKFQSM